ncbi:alanyl-tRNA synthetase [Spinellus fusiger]|nr:alanyl-tRNA synthetase [Spinellus fusiger]
MYQARLLRSRAPVGFVGRQQPSLFSSFRWIQKLTSSELRSRFTQHFTALGHTHVQSASLIPHNDKSLLFTNAGMVSLKNHFLKPHTAPFKAATSVQKCLRAGGKHNDLDNVGYTARHHTFFEMLGNFSFGKYSKKEAIDYAWRFLIHELELPLSRLRVTILEGDEETYALWKAQGLSDDKIIQCGKEDNFWTMGEGEGPCGPCTEIFWDTQSECLDERWLEIWNIVSMENYRTAEGQLEKLPVPCIDTGMGLERMICVLQSKNNNFQIDQFQSLIGGLQQVMKDRGLKTVDSVDPTSHEKIIADHFRAMCFLIGDGVVPSNVGRGYVLRRIIRRALRSARQLGLHQPFLTALYPYLLEGFTDDTYPELTTRAASISSVIVNEEISFLSTMDRGMALLENVFQQPELQSTRTIPPDIAFQLYSTYGFPFDLTLIIAKEKGWTIDIEAVEELKETHKKMGRKLWKADAISDKARLAEWRNMNLQQQFIGYDYASVSSVAEILASEPVIQGNKMVVNVAIHPCPFYGLGGGQSPDTGYIVLGNGQRWKVKNVFQPFDGCLALRLEPDTLDPDFTVASLVERDQEYFQSGQKVDILFDTEHRHGIEIHHSATHVLNAGLRSVLKADIVQAGSTVEPHKLRFDFTYGKPLTLDQLQSVEEWVNTAALSKGAMSVQHMKLTEAIEVGAIATFSEKYGDIVRVVEFDGISKELCGGTHVKDIRALYPFKIVGESSVAAGTRRIEAVAGLSCAHWYRKSYEPVSKALRMLRANSTAEIVDKIDKTMQQTKDLQRKLDLITEKLASAGEAIVPPISVKMKDISVKLHLIDKELDAGYMQKRANVLRQTQSESVHILINGNTIVVALDPRTIQQETANTIMRHLFKHVKGAGGGQKEFAQGRISEPIFCVEDIESKIATAFEKA